MFKNLFQRKENKQENNSVGATNQSTTDIQEKPEEKKKVHGEDGVCCGGCGGQ